MKVDKNQKYIKISMFYDEYSLYFHVCACVSLYVIQENISLKNIDFNWAYYRFVVSLLSIPYRLQYDTQLCVLIKRTCTYNMLIKQTTWEVTGARFFWYWLLNKQSITSFVIAVNTCLYIGTYTYYASNVKILVRFFSELFRLDVI